MANNVQSSRMVTLSPELWERILEFIPPNPFVYMQLSKVSRLFYTVLTSDRMWWRCLNPYGWQTDVYLKFTRLIARERDNQIRRCKYFWMDANLRLSKLPASSAQRPLPKYGVDNLYSFLGYNVYQYRRRQHRPLGDYWWQLRSCLYNFPKELESPPPNFKNNKEWALEAVRLYPTLILHLHSSVKHDKDIVLAALQDGNFELAEKVLEACETKYLGDKDVMLAAVKKNGRLLEMATANLLTDHELVRAALRQNEGALRTPKLKVTRSLVKLGLLTAPVLEHLPEYWLDDEIVKLAIFKYPRLLMKLPSQWKDDEDIQILLRESWGGDHLCRPERFKDDENTVLKVINICPFALESASARLRNKREVVLAAISKDRSSLQFASKRLQSDPLFVEQVWRGSLQSTKLVQASPPRRSNSAKTLLAPTDFAGNPRGSATLWAGFSRLLPFSPPPALGRFALISLTLLILGARYLQSEPSKTLPWAVVPPM